jgi:hypothetical protein
VKLFKWSFERLRTTLVEAVKLNYPNSNDTFILVTDASDNTIGAELSQIQKGEEKTICQSIGIDMGFSRSMLYYHIVLG